MPNTRLVLSKVRKAMSLIQAQGFPNREVSMNADIGDRMKWPPLSNEKLPWTLKEEAAMKKQILEQAEMIDCLQRQLEEVRQAMKSDHPCEEESSKEQKEKAK